MGGFVESLYCAPETIITLDVNYTVIKIKKSKKKKKKEIVLSFHLHSDSLPTPLSVQEILLSAPSILPLFSEETFVICHLIVHLSLRDP